MLIRSKAPLRVSFWGGGTDVSPYPQEKGAKTIALTGKNGAELAKIVDLVLKVPSDDTPRIQEAHITILHVICYLIEKRLFG